MCIFENKNTFILLVAMILWSDMGRNDDCGRIMTSRKECFVSLAHGVDVNAFVAKHVQEFLENVNVMTSSSHLTLIVTRP